MNHKKMQEFLRTGICIAGGFLIICLIGQLLYRYIRYGEQAKQETQNVYETKVMRETQDVYETEVMQETQDVYETEVMQETQDVYETKMRQEAQEVYGFGEGEMSVTEGEKETETAKTTESTNAAERSATAEESMPHIRVQLLSQDYESKFHTEISVTSDSSFQAVWLKQNEDGKLVEVQQKEYMAGEVFAVSAEEEKAADGNVLDESAADEICISVKEGNSEPLRITSFSRADGYPEYGGTLYLYREENGFILINELQLEEYLYSVVSSEIPSGYPIEAQKAQAVCARTYAKKCMERAQENGAAADLDDSVSWQVYNNYKSSEISRTAVDATRGEVLNAENALYYSTSCLSEKRNDLDSDGKFAEFLDEVPDEEAEYGSPWIRWNVEIDHQTILEQLKGKYDCTAERIDRMEVTKRAGDGQVQKIRIVCGEQVIEVEGEYQIRNILSVKDSGIHLSDGSTVEQMRMLPSAYFVFGESIWEESGAETLVNSKKVVYINGGGYGHGTGMSQCGAAAMAKAGADYKQILQYYYDSELYHT